MSEISIACAPDKPGMRSSFRSFSEEYVTLPEKTNNPKGASSSAGQSGQKAKLSLKAVETEAAFANLYWVPCLSAAWPAIDPTSDKKLISFREEEHR